MAEQEGGLLIKPVVMVDGARTFGPRARVSVHRLATAYFGETRAAVADYWRYVDQLEAMLKPHNYIVHVQQEGGDIVLESPDGLFRFLAHRHGALPKAFKREAGYFLLENPA